LYWDGSTLYDPAPEAPPKPVIGDYKLEEIEIITKYHNGDIETWHKYHSE